MLGDNVIAELRWRITMITPELYILYGFLAFISLLLVTLVATTLRTAQDIGILKRGQTALGEKIDHVEQRLNDRIDGVEQRLNDRIDGVEQRLNDRIDGVEQGLNARIDGVEQGLNARIDGVEQSLGGRLGRVESRIDLVENRLFLLAQDVSEIKGSVQALHERVDLVMRHRHQPTGEVVLTPEELPAD